MRQIGLKRAICRQRREGRVARQEDKGSTRSSCALEEEEGHQGRTLLYHVTDCTIGDCFLIGIGA
jgi:hypothetical protein